MSNYKVKVNNEVESKEVQGLFFELGGQWATCGRTYNNMVNVGDYVFFNCSKYLQYGLGINKEELTIPQLKDLVVLKRNSIDDATHTCGTKKYYLTHNEFYEYMDDKWVNVDEYVDGCIFDPITNPLKEYLVPQDNGKYALTKATEKRVSDWVEVPEGAEAATFCKNEGVNYWKENGLKWFSKVNKEWCIYSDMEEHIKNHDHKIVWTRHTQPEELPFIDDEPKSLNDTYAEIEQVRKTLVKSDGGSSAYHQRKIPKKMLKRWKKSGMIEVTDVIRLFLNNDFTRGNVFKAHSRISSLENGCGKDGASKDYDLNKVLFFAKDDIENK